MAKFYVYCVPKFGDYGCCLSVDVNTKASDINGIYAIKSKANEEYGDEYTICQVVSSNWAKILNEYNKLFTYCEDNNLFEKCDVTRRIGDCCGYDLTVNSICNYGKVILDDYHEIQMNIAYLGEEQFAEIVCALEEIID